MTLFEGSCLDATCCFDPLIQLEAVLCCCLSNSAVLPMIDTTDTAAAPYVLWVWVRPAVTPSYVCVLILSHPHKLSSSRSDQAPKHPHRAWQGRAGHGVLMQGAVCQASGLSVWGQQGCLTSLCAARHPYALAFQWPLLCCASLWSIGALGALMLLAKENPSAVAVPLFQPRHQLSRAAAALSTAAGSSRAADCVAAVLLAAFYDLRVTCSQAPGHE